MEEKKNIKVSITSLLLIISIAIILVMSVVLIKNKNEKQQKDEEIKALNSQIKKLENKANELQDKVNNISNIVSNNKKDEVSYVIVEIEDTGYNQGIKYKSKKITDANKFENLIQIINKAEEYTEKSFIPDFGDVPPYAEIHYDNGKVIRLTAGDQINDDGDIVNLISQWESEDGNEKTTYKVNAEVGEIIINLFND